MRDHCYWPLVSDLSNLLSHRPVALQFLSDDSLLEMWFSFLSMFQGGLHFYHAISSFRELINSKIFQFRFFAILLEFLAISLLIIVWLLRLIWKDSLIISKEYWTSWTNLNYCLRFATQLMLFMIHWVLIWQFAIKLPWES